MPQVLTLEERFPSESADMFRTAFKHHILDNKSRYMSFISTYFAYLVLVEGDNSLSEPIKLTNYKTVLSVLENNKMMYHSEDVTLSTLEGVEIITWRERLDYFIQKYIEEEFDELFFHKENNPNNISNLLNAEELLDPAKKQDVLDHLIGVIGLPFFEKLETKLQNDIYHLNPSFLYRKGEKPARKLMEEAKQAIDTLTKDLNEFSEDLRISNHLWEAILETYKVTYLESLPKGKVDLDLYTAKIEPLLQRLKTYGIDEPTIRGLALMDTVFTPETMKVLIRFSYA